MDESANLFYYLRVVLKRKKLCLVVIAAFVLGSVFYSLSLKNQYRAFATIMPLGGGAGGGGKLLGLAAQMGLAGLAGGGLTGGGSSASQIQLILQSRTLAEQMIQKHQLMKIFYRDQWDEANNRWKTDDPKKIPTLNSAVKTLHSIVSFPEGTASAINVTVVHQDPRFAMEMANDYVEVFADYISKNALTSAKRNRLFIEGQFERNKRDLLESGKELSEFYALNRISNVNPIVDVDISISDFGIRSAKMASAVPTQNGGENASLTSAAIDSVTSGVPGISTAFAKVGGQIQDLQAKTEAVRQEISEVKKVKDVPQQVYLKYLVLRDAMLGQVNSLLAQQLEMAKIEEWKEDLNFQVIDWAYVPESPYKPDRRKIVLISFTTGVFVSIFVCFIVENFGALLLQYRRQMRSDS